MHRYGRHTLGSLLALALVALAATETPAQPPASSAAIEPEAAPVDEVIVRGRRLSDLEADLRIEVKKFLEEATQPARGRGYARWDGEVCVGVTNLKVDGAQYIIDRISAVALELGLQPGEPGCSPQVHVIFSTDGAATATTMVDSDPRAFRPVGAQSGMDLGVTDLQNFRSAKKAVRWWHVSLPVDARTGAPAIELPEMRGCPRAPNCYPTITVAGPSRVHSGIEDKLLTVFIIVDSTMLTGTTWEQLGDYLALVALAQVDPNAAPGSFDSILNVFSNPAAYSGLTDWDRNFLHALYTMNPQRTPRMQGNEIANRIARRELR